ncbi:MAG: thiol peroxidase [Tannerellaceae bacterium]|jgi:thiol peroxidase|nr:thiol peroxidase [Tannerellaceae bacterium]
MANITFNGQPANTIGNMPLAGSIAPDFTGIQNNLSPLNLHSLKGKNIVMNIFPSLDTPVCACSVRQFNIAAADLPNTVVLCLSKDLPFAQSRFCVAEGITNLITLSLYLDPSFDEKYGMLITDGPLRGLFARGIIVINTEMQITYTELVSEITNEPNYQAAVAAVGKQAFD